MEIGFRTFLLNPIRSLVKLALCKCEAAWKISLQVIFIAFISWSFAWAQESPNLRAGHANPAAERNVKTESKISPSFSLARTPLAFEPNQGQGKRSDRFLARGPGYLLRLESDKAVMEFSQPVDASKNLLASGRLKALRAGAKTLSMALVGASRRPSIKGELQLEGTASYFTGSEPKSWIKGLPTYARVNYKTVYPGIDLAFYGKENRLEYDFLLQPGADAGKIGFSFEGNTDIRIDDTGDLMLRVGSRDVKFLKPVAYQISKTDGKKHSVDVTYRLRRQGRHLGFSIGAYDHSQDLVIDPVLDYGTYLPVSDSIVTGIAVDRSGNTYLPAEGGAAGGTYNGFSILKFDPNGNLLSTTVLSTNPAGVAVPTAIAVSSTGTVYVTGYAGTGLPSTSNAYQATNPNGDGGASFNAFLAVFVPGTANPSSPLTPSYISYLGGTGGGNDFPNSIAVDVQANAYIAGVTGGEPFPTTAGAYQIAYPAGATSAGFIAKFNPSKSGAASLVYSTLLGGSNDILYGVAVDGAGSAYVTGSANLTDIPATSGAFAYSGFGSGTAINVTKLNAAGTGLVYSSYLGPGVASGIAVDGSGDAYVTGVAYSEDYPTTAGAYQTSYPNAFATELNAAGTALVYSTFLGGPSGATNYTTAQPISIALTPACASACPAYISGITSQADFPVINSVQSYEGANPTGFVVELAGNGASAIYSTYLGGATAFTARPYLQGFGLAGFTPAIGVDGSANAYVTGNVSSPADFPITQSPAEPAVPLDGVYLAKIGPATAGNLLATNSIPVGSTLTVPNAVVFPGPNVINVSSVVYPGTPVTTMLMNAGSKAISLTSMVVTPANEFAETDNCNSAIAAGSFCTLTLMFTPESVGTRNGSITVTSSASTTPVVIALSGTAVAEPFLQWSPTSLSFPNTVTGATSPAQTATLTNVGHTPVTGLGNFGDTLGSASTFPILDNCPSQLDPGQSCTVSVQFAPPTAGLATASIYPQAGYNTPFLSLSGTGVASGSGGSGSSVMSPASLNLGSLAVNTSTTGAINFVDTSSTVPVTVNSISVALVGNTGSVKDFSVGACLASTLNVQAPPYQVAAGSSCALTVNFTPSIVGTETAQITVTDSSPNSPHTVTVSGAGLAATQALEFTPGNQVFVDQPLGYQSASQTFSVYNTGSAPVVIDRAIISGDFQITGDQCSSRTLGPPTAPGVNLNAGCTIDVAFTPTALGARSGTLTLIAGGIPQVLNLMGNGVAVTGNIVPVPNTLTFPAQPLGLTSATQYLYLTNPGNVPVTVNALTTTGDYAVTGSNCGTPYIIGPGGSCYYDVAFTPTSSTVNPRTGTVTINSSAGTSTVALSGTGEVATQTIGFTPTAASFGSVSNGTPSYTQTVYVRNTGTEAVTMSADPAVTGNFSLINVGCPANGIVAPGTSCSIGVIFTPNGSGAQTGTLTLTDTAGTQVLNLSGTGVVATAPVIVNVQPVNFDLQVPGTSSNSYAALYNYGSSEVVHIASASITAGSSAFTLDDGSVSSNSCNLDPVSQGGTPVAPGSSCVLNIVFMPPTAGYFTGTITFVDTSENKYVGTLAGYAPAVVNSARVSPSNLGFVSQVVGAADPGNYTTIVYLTNTGNLPFTVGTVTGTDYSAAGPSATAEFSTGNPYGDTCSGATVPPGSQCYVGVSFAPTAAGVRTGTLNFPVTYSGATKPVIFTGTFTGTGVAQKNEAIPSPSSAVFTDQPVGTTTVQASVEIVRLFNAGNLPWTVGTVTGANYSSTGSSATAEFSPNFANYGDGCSNQAVAPGNSCYVGVQFTPNAVGTRTGTLVFPVTYAGASTSVNLTATLSGKGIADTSGVIVTPNAVVFTDQVVGITGNYQTTQTIQVRNTGNLPISVGTVTGTDYSVSGPTATAEFSSYGAGGYDGCSGQTVAAGASCGITLLFTPAAAGTRTGSLVFPVTLTGATSAVNYTATLSGVGVAIGNSAVVSPATTSFGDQLVGTTTGALSALVVTLSNTGNYPFTVGTIGGNNYSASGPTATTEFSLDVNAYDSSCGQTINPGSSCSIPLFFTPTATGTRTGTVVFPVLYTGAASPVNFTATLTGTGIATNSTLVFSQPSVVFGNQPVGTTSSQVQVTLMNYSANSLPISSIVLGGANPGDFTESDSCGGASGTTISAGGSCTLYLNFNPALSSLGARSATITEKDPGTGGSRTITLTGTGTADVSAVTFYPASASFSATETVNDGTPGKVVSVNYQGTLPITINSVLSSDSADFPVVQDGCTGQMIVPGGYCDLVIAFTPTKPNALSATIKVTDTATGSPQTFVVTGGGSAAMTSTTSLAATPATAAFGTLFTLVATMKSGATGNPPIANGSVTFYNGTKSLGTVQVVTRTSGGGTIGTATLKTLYLPVGANSITAKYTGASATSTSAASTVTVTGKYQSSALLTSTGTQTSGYVLTTTVEGGGPQPVVPTGSVVFTDRQTNTTLGTVALDASTISQYFTEPTPLQAGSSNPETITMADVNGDGKLDLIVGNYITSAFSVLLGNGDGTYGAPIPAPGTGGAAGNIVVGDLNGDGKLDIVISNYNFGYAGVFLGNGDGTFQGEVDYDGAVGFVALGDFNGDGILDIVTANGNGSVDLLLGNGDGTFQDPVVTAVAGTGAAVGVGDFNGDGKLDVVTTGGNAGGGSAITVLLGNGNGTFRTPIVSPGSSYGPYRLAVADLNGDGKLDVVSDDNGTGIGVFLGNGDGSFQTEYAVTGYGSVGRPAVADVNADGKPDLILPTGGAETNLVEVLLGKGDGTFAAPVSYPTGSYAAEATVGDINSDGKPDVAVVNQTDGTVTLLLNQFTQTAKLTGVKLPGISADSVTANYSGDVNYAPSTTNTLSLASNPPPGTTTLTVTPATGPVGTLFTLSASVKTSTGAKVTAGTVNFSVNGSLLANIELDSATGVATYETRSLPAGTDSLAAAFLGTDNNLSSSSTTVAVMVTGKYVTTTALSANGVQGSYSLTAMVDGYGLGSPSGSVVFTDNTTGTTLGTLPLTKTAATSSFLPSSTASFTTGGQTRWVVAGDFNGDGKQDIAVANYGTTTVSIFLGKGDGTFGAPIAATVLSSPVGLATGDFNGDGKLDLAVGYYNGSNNVTILLGNGDGTFQAASSYAVGTNPESVVVGDFNGDGVQDLAVGNYDGTMVSVLLGKGDGTFGAANSFGSNFNGVYGLAIGDFNHDGKIDIVTANGGTVGIFLGNGDGTFGAETDFISDGSISYSVSVSDVNLDGKLDLVTANSDSTISVLLGNGDGTFQAPQSYATAAGSYSLRIADINGDGNPDLVTANFASNTVSVLLGNGAAGTFQAGQTYNVGVNPYAVALADFNGDGRLDIATANFGDSTASVLIGSVSSGVTLSGVALPGTGADTVSATYSGDTAFAGSSSNTLTLPSKPLATTTTLAATPATAALGAVVTLTATVADSNGKAVTGGSVSFYTGSTLLSTVQLVSITNGTSISGTATYATAALALGSDSIKAVFNGTDLDAVSTSQVQTVTVSGMYPTSTMLSATGTQGDFTLTATVQASSPLTPTGKVTFTDTTSGAVLGAATLNPASLLRGFTTLTTPGISIDGAPTIVLADVNGDGKLDILVGGYYPVAFSVLLGNGDGTYQAGIPITGNKNGAYNIAVGDFNGDGKLDVVTSTQGSTAAVFLGKGDGTFGPEVDYDSNTFIYSLAIGDFNGDGKVDIAVGRTTGFIDLLFGNGDGSFSAPVSIEAGFQNEALIVADFNGDGKLDIATTGAPGNHNAVTVLLGNGNGTFQSGIASPTVNNSPYRLAAADLNGDGKLDLVTNDNDVYIGVMLGNGDGTFSAEQNVTPYGGVGQPAVIDLNGDGIPDLIVPNSGATNTVSVFPGKGDGTFGGAQTYATGNYPVWAATGDVSSDGRPDIAVLNLTGETVTVLLNNDTQTAILAGVNIPGTGTHNVTATYAGDSSFATSTSSAIQLAATLASSAITLAAQPSASVAYGQPLSVLVTVSGATGTNTPTGNVIYTLDGGTSQTATLVSGAVTLNLSTLAAGSHSLLVNYAGDQIHAGAVKATLPLTITKASQSITFGPIANTTYGSGVFAVVATSNAGLPVTVKVVSGPATISGNAVTLTGAGTVVLEADQSGNANYNAATAVQQTFSVAKAPLAVAVNNATKVYGTANPAFTSAINGLIGSDTVVVNYTTTATTTSPYGTYPINATVSGAASSNYATTITAGTLTITKTVLTVTVNPATRQYGAANPAFTGTIAGLQGNDTATAVYATTATAASPVGSNYPITATVMGNNLANYTVNVVQAALTITPAPLTITVSNAVKTYGTANPAFTSTFSGALSGDSIPVTYSTPATAASGVGSYAIAASTTDANYTTTSVPGTLTIKPAPLTILINSFTKVYGSANPTLTGTVNGLLFSDSVTTAYSTTATQLSTVGAYTITAGISGGASANYTPNITPGTLIVTQAVLTATAADQTRNYSLPNSPLTYAITGFVNGDTAAVVSGTATLTTSATTLSAIGSYPITFATENLVATNYSFLYVPGTLHVIGSTPQTITFNPLASATYGAAPITLAATASSGLPVAYAVSGPATLSGSVLTITGAGQVTVTASQAGNIDFAPATTVKQSFSIAKAPLTVTAVNISRQYDTANPALTYTVTGFANTDTLASAVTGTATLTTTATLTSPQSTYPITFVTESLAAANYSFTYVAGTLTVTGGTAQTITFGSFPNAAYGAAPITLAATASSGLPVTYTASGPATLSGSTLTITGAGVVTVLASQAGNLNFAAAVSVSQSFTVARAALTVRAADASRQYGVANPVFTYAITGFVNNETPAVLGGSATLTTTATSTSLAGSYPITFATEALTSANYSFTYVNGTLTITAGVAATPSFSIASGLYTTGTGIYTAPQSITITDTTPGATIYYTLNGMVPTVNSAVYSAPISIGTNETLEAAAIATGYTLSSAASATYTFVPVTASPTALTFGSQSVLTQSAAKTVNVTNPGANVLTGFTTSITGANPSDFSVVSTGCTGLVNSQCSLTVAFTPQSAGARSATLNLSYAGTGSPVSVPLSGNGTALTTALTLIPSSASLTYGQSLSIAATLSGSPAPTGLLTYSLDGGAAQTAPLSAGSTSIGLGVVTAGNHALAVSYAGNSAYGAASQSLSFTVAKAVLTVTATSVSRQFGVANPALTYTTAGFVNGDTAAVVSGTATLTTTATSTSVAGSYPITFATEGLAASNYSFNYVTGTLVVSGGKPQTITFGALPNVTYGNSPITLTATASSALPVTYTVTGPATLSGSTLTITGAGSVTVTAVQPGDNNYAAATSVAQSFTVTRAVLTVTAASLSRQYLAANPALTYTTVGFVNGDTVSAVSGTATLTTTATNASAVGTYPISFSVEALTAANYSFTYVAGSLTIGTVGQTINFGPLAGTTYGVSPITLTATASSGLAVAYTVAGPATVSGSTVSVTGAGLVTVTAAQAGNVDYTAAPQVSQSFTVAKAVLTATATNASRLYGAANPSLTYTTAGFVHGDGVGVVSGTATLATTATTTSAPGVYPITFATETLTAVNYTFNYVPGTLTVGSVPTITFGALANTTYGTAPITLAATASDGLPVSYTVTGPAALSGSKLSITGAGTITVTASQAGNATYPAAASVSQSFTVSKAPLTVTAANATRAYGAANPAFTYGDTGFVNGDTITVVSGTATLSTTATSTSAPGAYPITFATEGLTAANYSFNYVAGTLTVGTGAQTILFGSLPNLIYGATPITLSATASSGLPVSYSVTGPAAISGSNLSITGAGAVTVTASQAGNGNYAPATPVTQNFTVARATLTATATSLVRPYNTANPALTYAVTGFVNADTVFVVSGAATLTTTATLASSAGSYPITFLTEGLVAANYSFTYVPGTLTIGTPATPSITFPAPPNTTYGATAITLTATASDGLPVSYSVTGPATVSGSILTVTGAGTVAVMASQAGNSTFPAAASVVRSFTVAKAALTVTAVSASRQAGTANPALTYTLSGFVKTDTAAVVSGSATLTTTTTMGSQAGSYPITFATEALTAANYSFTYVPGILTVTPLTIVAAPSFSPAGGTFTSAQSVMLNDTSAGAVIHYTIDSSAPNANSPIYTVPIQVGSTETINAIAVLNGAVSAETSATFTINPGQCQTINYSKGFTSTGLALNGGATVSNSSLQITDGGNLEARSAYYAAEVPVTRFTTDFTLQILNPVADGMTFVIQSNNTKIVGGNGGGLGYGGIPHSVAFKLDLHNNTGEGTNSTGMYVNGAFPGTPSIDLSPTGIDLHSGHIFAVHVAYANAVTTGTITDTVTGASATRSFPGDISQSVGASGFVGFTGGTGGKSSNQRVLTWSFSGGTGCPAK